MTPSMGSALKDLKLHRLLVVYRGLSESIAHFHSKVPRRVLGSRSVPIGSLCKFCQMDKRITRYNSLKANEAGRQAHLSGPIAQALGANAP